MDVWKVGDLARSTGLTVRTLHHYDEIGLLRPSHRTAAGHRLYTSADVARLQQVTSLRSLGFGLEAIRELLDKRRASAVEVVRRHAQELRRRLDEQRRLLERLEALAEALAAGDTTSVDTFFGIIEETVMLDKYYTAEQMEYLQRRREEVGEARIKEVEAEWPRLMEEVRAEMERGTHPADPVVQALARRWNALIEEFTGGDEGVRQSLGKLYQSESHVRGMDIESMRPLMEYVGKALVAASDQEQHSP